MKKRTKVETPTHIRDLVSDPSNRRSHNPRNIGMVVDSLHAVGAARSIVIDEDNVILAGNGVTEAAGEAGITRVRVIDADGDELIAVRRKGLTDEQKRNLAIADNRTSELSDWNVEQLKADVANGLSLSQFWTDEEAAKLLADASAAGNTTAGSALNQAIQLKPTREYVLIMCDEGESGEVQFAQLREKFGLGLVRRGGYRRGSAFDDVGVERVINAAKVLDGVVAVPAAAAIVERAAAEAADADHMETRPGTYDEHIVKEVRAGATYLNFLQPVAGDRVLDIGAHIGTFAVEAARRGASVVSYEPNPDNAALARANTARWGTTVIEAAVGAQAGEATLYLATGANTGNHTILKKRGRVGVPVRVVSFADVLREVDPTVVKMDCEGAELELWPSVPPEAWDNVRAFAMEVHFSMWGGDTRTTYEELLERVRATFPNVTAKPWRKGAWFGLVYASR